MNKLNTYSITYETVHLNVPMENHEYIDAVTAEDALTFFRVKMHHDFDDPADVRVKSMRALEQ